MVKFVFQSEINSDFSKVFYIASILNEMLIIRLFQSMSSLYGDQLLLDNYRQEQPASFNYVLQQKLRQQQLESEEDSRWLAESETHLVSFLFK